jgi:hypothetical protein
MIGAHFHLGATPWLTLRTGSSLHQHQLVALHSSLPGPACSSDCIRVVAGENYVYSTRGFVFVALLGDGCTDVPQV